LMNAIFRAIEGKTVFHIGHREVRISGI